MPGFYRNLEKVPMVFQNILTLPFRQELMPLLKPLDIKVVFKYEDTIRKLIIRNSPLLDEIGGVYCIPCKVCDRVYVGQTGKSLLERIKQHKYNVRTANESSAVFKHQQEFNHNIITFEVFKLIDVMINFIDECFFKQTKMSCYTWLSNTILINDIQAFVCLRFVA